MKKLMLVTILVGFLAVPALATPTLGWWELEHPRATHQSWDFTSPFVYTDGGTIYEYEAEPEVKDNPDTAHAWVGDADTLNKDYSIYDGAGSFIDDTAILVQLKIDNFPDPLAYKEIWVDVDYTGILTGIDVDGTGSAGPYTTVFLKPQGDADFGVRIYPNPEEETIWFTIEAPCGGDAELFAITVDTICIPAPGAVLLGSLGVGLVGWLRRRRSL